MSEPKDLILTPRVIFKSLADDMGTGLKPFDVRVFLMLLPDLLQARDPLKINLSHLAVLMGRNLPQVSRSMSSLVKAGYLVRHSRSKTSFTYTLNTMFAAPLFGGVRATQDLVAWAKGAPYGPSTLTS